MQCASVSAEEKCLWAECMDDGRTFNLVRIGCIGASTRYCKLASHFARFAVCRFDNAIGTCRVQLSPIDAVR